jgi:hypothetical protein
MRLSTQLREPICPEICQKLEIDLYRGANIVACLDDPMVSPRFAELSIIE